MYYVYILTNKRNGTLYVGFTHNLVKRIWEHRNKVVKGFTQNYDLTKLVYYESTEDKYIARNREHRLKRWNRKWKLDLIEKTNPLWVDLYESIIP